MSPGGDSFCQDYKWDRLQNQLHDFLFGGKKEYISFCCLGTDRTPLVLRARNLAVAKAAVAIAEEAPGANWS